MTIRTDKRNFIATCLNAAVQQLKQYTGADNCEFSKHSGFTPQDWQMFFDMQDNPPEPTERMKKALQTYHKIIDNQL